MAFTEYKAKGTTLEEAKKNLNIGTGGNLIESLYQVSIGESEPSENINNYEIAFAQALENAGISAYKYDNNSNPPKIQITARYEVRVQPCGAGPSERSSPTLTNLLT
jgi:hypothetical protein